MKHYKKRTIALCLASLLTVLGSFGADNYNNTLMDFQVNSGSRGYVKLTAYTKEALDKPFVVNKMDDNTYIIVLPETNSEAEPPNIKGYDNIESIEISTFPYATDKAGYTRITIKTIDKPIVRADAALFISETEKHKQIQNKKQAPAKTYSYGSLKSDNEDTAEEEVEEQEQEQEEEKKVETVEDNNQTKTSSEQTKTVSEPFGNYNNKVDSATEKKAEHFVAVITVFFIIFLTMFLLLLGRDKMKELVGDNNNFSLDEQKSKKSSNSKKSKKKQIKKTINSLNETYKNQPQMTSNMVTGAQKQTTTDNLQADSAKDETVIVDLDELYKEQVQDKSDSSSSESVDESEEEDDLADLLNDFSFDDEDTEETEDVEKAEEPEKSEDVEEEELFDEELYEKIITNTSLKFTNDDISKISELIFIELTNDMLEHIKEYKKLESEKPKPLTQTQIFENLLTSYTINQNITFTPEDIASIKKLMTVELDENFIRDLRTNPERTKQVEKEIKEESQKDKKYVSKETLTLNVKDLLPDLSLELKKHGNKRVESNAKPQVVFYSEGYEVSKLSVSDDLSDLSTALKTKGANEFKPSFEAPIVETGYDVSTLSIKDELPDLADVKAHPQKYQEEKKPKASADEDALLKSIANVTFKPFYEEVQNEMNQFDNFEIINTEDSETDELPPEITIEEPEPIESIPEITVEKPENILLVKRHYESKKHSDDAQALIKIIEERQAQRKAKQQLAEEQEIFKKELRSNKSEEKEQQKTKTETVMNENPNVIKTVKCGSDDYCCKLVKTDDGYSVLGCINDTEKELKHYKTLKTTNMQVRLNDKTNGVQQYLVKIGIHKFLFSIINNNMEFVMDLC